MHLHVSCCERRPRACSMICHACPELCTAFSMQGFLMIPYRIMLPTLFPLFIMLRKMHILPCAHTSLLKLCCWKMCRSPTRYAKG